VRMISRLSGSSSTIKTSLLGMRDGSPWRPRRG
jgi:hypothetical protein